MNNAHYKTIYVKVKLVIDRDADAQEVVSEMDYEFDHANIADTEIVDVEED